MAALTAAAPEEAEQTAQTENNHLLQPENTTSPDTETSPALSGDVQSIVVDFIEKEVGSDLKSLKNVGHLLQKLKEENIALEEQVRTNDCLCGEEFR